MDLITLRGAGGGSGKGAGVAGIAREQFGTPVVLGLIAALRHEGEGLRSGIGGFQIHEQRAQLIVQRRNRGRIHGVEFLLHGRGDLGVRLAHANEGELIDSQEFGFLTEIQLGPVQTIQSGDKFTLQGLIAMAREGAQGGEGGLRIFLGECFVLPLRDGLMLHRHAGGPADVAVGMAEMFPGLGGCAGLTFVEGFQFLPCLASVGIGGLGLHGLGTIRTGVGDAVQGALAATPADGEVHGAIDGVDRGIGHAQLGAGDKFLTSGGVRGAFSRYVHGGHRAVGPIQAVNGFLVFGGKLRAETGDHAHGRARADAVGAGQAVRIPLRPFAGAGAPAEISAAGDVVKTCGPIPRRAGVPFHVRIVGEQFAVDVKGEIVGIAETHGDGLPVFAILIEAGDPAAGSANAAGMAAGIGQAFE